MLDFLFSLSAPLGLLCMALFGLACVGVAVAVMTAFRRQHTTVAHALPAATFLSTIATAWALSLGFAAADVWATRARAERAATAERSAITRIVGLAGKDALDSPQIHDALTAYSSAVIDIEWGGLANVDPAAEVDQALQQIRAGVVALARGDAPETLIGKLISDFDELQDARNERLAIGNETINAYKWYLVFFLTLLSMVTIAVLHADRPRAARTAMGIFMIASVVSLWILSLHASPYLGSARLHASEIRVSKLGT